METTSITTCIMVVGGLAYLWGSTMFAMWATTAFFRWKDTGTYKPLFKKDNNDD